MPMPTVEVDEDSPAFHLLADLIARDELVAVTGAGISYGLKRKGGSDGVPGWEELLRRIHKAMQPSLPSQLNNEISYVLSDSPIPTQILLESASRLREVDAKLYESELLSQVTPEPGQFSPTHTTLEILNPRGVITFNYDDCHETAYKSVFGEDLGVLTPYSEKSLVKHLSARLRERFYLKAHGCIHDNSGPLVLDWNSYREILAKLLRCAPPDKIRCKVPGMKAPGKNEIPCSVPSAPIGNGNGTPRDH